ncbi:hypothetical protein T09_8920 [Trichinella sp. T9]|nr:hypothetical protein T09_8920 [Trichinella sp. T9]
MISFSILIAVHDPCAEREFCQNGGSCTSTVIKQCNSSSECLNGGFCASVDSVRTRRRWYKCMQVNLTEAGKNEEQLRMKLEFYYCRIWKMYACSLG